ncbi:hypothetical protein HLB23_11455 [Nocardia uniformis]|uniref:Uncharacterized protein n=1 Tax=Nocardia uniformis TaxID=53432 RepID=A0A849CBX7_9NOCA|nr:hypothetical protein [Nocardia uniformis]NNH70471.1 hypothetical protein [Nocardia uniformis]
MALPIAGRSRKLRARDWTAFAAEIGLPERAAMSARELALNAAASVAFTELPFHDSPLRMVERELRRRRMELAQ